MRLTDAVCLGALARHGRGSLGSYSELSVLLRLYATVDGRRVGQSHRSLLSHDAVPCHAILEELTQIDLQPRDQASESEEPISTTVALAAVAAEAAARRARLGVDPPDPESVHSCIQSQ
jgi:hypothetical protein